MTESTSFLQKSLFDEYAPIKEAHLEEPMLLFLMQSALAKNGPLNSFKMHEILSRTFELSPADKEVIWEKGSSSLTLFRRTVNNAYSHASLVKKGWARETPDGLEITDNGCIRLNDLMRRNSATAQGDGAQMVSEHVERSFESNLKLRVLDCLDLLQAGTKKRIELTEIRLFIKAEMVLSPDDMKILKGRTDSRIDQIIRNLLISNNSLIKEGLITYKKGQGFAITKAGKLNLAVAKVSCIPFPPFDLVNQMYSDPSLSRASINSAAAARRNQEAANAGDAAPAPPTKRMKP